MTHPGPRGPTMPRAGRRAPALLLAVALAVLSGPARAQSTDCSALRDAIDAPAPAADPARFDGALQRQRDEIQRLRAYADQTGCGGGVFDDPDSQPCRALARRVELLQVGLQRLQDQASRGGDGRRRDLQARFDAECSAAAPDGAGAPAAVTPVDPDAPPGPAAAPPTREVICVRHCDGAHYPLAVDVEADRMADMDRICQAQCPAAESSAYASQGDDLSNATAADGSSYASLPAAFAYLRGPSGSCACRTPHQSWAEALAGAEALLQPHKGDVTVTAEISAAMARPVAAPVAATPAGAPRPSANRPVSKKRAKAPSLPAPPPTADDLTRAFRGSDPTL